MDGVLVIDKPTSCTSHDVVAKARRVLGTKRIGHLGTLDPLATGVLPLIVGRATRLAQFFRNRDKIYEGRLRLGFATDSYDRTGKATTGESTDLPTREQLEAAMRELTGTLQQVPPPVSAKKVGGVESYKLARKNLAVDLKSVEVEVTEFSLVDFEPPYARFVVKCSAGTYVRSLVHDAGRAVGCGAHVDQLRRTASGEFLIEQAATLERLEQLSAEGTLESAMVPTETLLPEIPSYRIAATMLGPLLSGRDFRTVPAMSAPQIKVLSHEGRLLAVADRAELGLYHPSIVL